VQKILSLSEAARSVPPLDGRTPHLASIWRWCRRGIRRGGTLVKLDYVRVGRRIGIPPEALDKFFRELAEADSTAPSVSNHVDDRVATKPLIGRSRSPRQRERDMERAREDLAATGLKSNKTRPCEALR
jgi:hypothetical protein